MKNTAESWISRHKALLDKMQKMAKIKDRRINCFIPAKGKFPEASKNCSLLVHMRKTGYEGKDMSRRIRPNA